MSNFIPSLAVAASLFIVPVAGANAQVVGPNLSEIEHAQKVKLAFLDKLRKKGKQTEERRSSSDCLDPARVADPDIRGHMRTLKSSTFCITEMRVDEAGFPWRFFVIKNTKRNGPLFVLPHDNENAAFPAGIYGLQKYGGTLIAVEASEKRLFRGQDPNRNFGTTASVAAACPKQIAPAPRFTQAIMQFATRSQPVIALHSNSNGWAGNGGSGTISIKRKSSVMLPFPGRNAKSKGLRDEDTVVVLASTKPPSQDRAQSNAVRYLNDRGVHVIYEHVRPNRNDCSLSNYIVLNASQFRYFNIEVETGQVAVQKQVLDILMGYVR